MARTDRFYIGQLQGSGMQTNLKPFAIPDDAFENLLNAYVFRGRIRKRFGSQLMEGVDTPSLGYAQLQSRLRIILGTTDGTGAFTGTVPVSGGAPIATPAIGQMFSIGDQIITVTDVAGATATVLNTGAGNLTYTIATGAVVTAGVTFTDDVYFYPALPVMGITNYESKLINDEVTFAFDTRFVYQFTTNAWQRLGTASWTGNNADFFWSCNWRGVTNDQTFLFATNFFYDSGTGSYDLIKYYDPAATPYYWTSMLPIVNNLYSIINCRIILPFKDRLLFLNTLENQDGVRFSDPNVTNAGTGNFNQTVAGAYQIGQQFIVGNTIFQIQYDTAATLEDMIVYPFPGVRNPPTAQFNITTGNLVITGNKSNQNLPVYYFDLLGNNPVAFVNRCRFSLNGDPTLQNGWIDQSPGLGGYIDAPTKEAIVTAQFLKDRLIVYFEGSTWELVYIGNQILPFVWQQINTELGAESTFSQVPFDKVVLGVGNIGIHACNGSNVDRIDEKIPDEVFYIHNASGGVARVYGIRDYYPEMVYWSFPSPDRTDEQPFNNRVFVYNYKNGSWAFNQDSITAFGYFQSAAGEGETWQSDLGEWQTDNSTWKDDVLVQSRTKAVIGGNQEGWTFLIDVNESRNAPALQITDMTFDGIYTVTITCIDHNLQPGRNGEGDYVAIENVQGVTGVNEIYPVSIILDADTFTVVNANFVGVYTGGGTVARVSSIYIQTKQYNFYADRGLNAAINKVDFLVDKTTYGEITVDYMVNSSPESQYGAAAISGALLGSGTLQTSAYQDFPLESSQSRLWHPIYPNSNGECIQFELYLSDSQLRDSQIAFSDFVLHGFTLYAQPTSRLQ